MSCLPTPSAKNSPQRVHKTILSNTFNKNPRSSIILGLIEGVVIQFHILRTLIFIQFVLYLDSSNTAERQASARGVMSEVTAS